MNNLNKKLQDFRQLKDLTQAEMAALLGVSRAQVSHFETGRTPISDELVNKVQEVFGVNLNSDDCLTEHPETDDCCEDDCHDEELEIQKSCGSKDPGFFEWLFSFFRCK